MAKVTRKECLREVVFSFVVRNFRFCSLFGFFFYNMAKQTSKTKYIMEEALKVCLRRDSDASDVRGGQWFFVDSGEEALSEEGNVAFDK